MAPVGRTLLDDDAPVFAVHTRAVWRPRDWLLVPFLVVVAAVGIAWGGRATVRTIRNWTPRTMSCVDFLAHPPSFDWVRLEGCAPASDGFGIESFGPANAAEEQKSSHVDVDAVYVPLGVAGGQTVDEYALVLRVDHGPILRLASTFPTERDYSAADEALAQPFEGLIERSLDRSERDRTKLRGLGLRIADDFLVLDYGARPRPLWLGLGSLTIGLGALGLLARKWCRRVRPVALAKARVVAR